MGEVEDFMNKARERLISSKVLYQSELYETSVSSSYYAIFLAAKALTLSKNFYTKKHSGVISFFGKEFVNKGYFSNELYNYFSEAFSLRDDSDYQAINNITEEIAKEQIETCGNFHK